MKSKRRESDAPGRRGVEPEFDIRPESIRMVPRRHLATAAETEQRHCKVRVTMYLDADIVGHFKARATRRNAAPYQTQINAALREHLQKKEPAKDYTRLVEDDRFIAAVAQRLADRTTSGGTTK